MKTNFAGMGDFVVEWFGRKLLSWDSALFCKSFFIRFFYRCSMLGGVSAVIGVLDKRVVAPSASVDSTLRSTTD